MPSSIPYNLDRSTIREHRLILRYSARCSKCGQRMNAGSVAFWSKRKGARHVTPSDCLKSRQ